MHRMDFGGRAQLDVGGIGSDVNSTLVLLSLSLATLRLCSRFFRESRASRRSARRFFRGSVR